jgi:SEC-C motif
MAMEHKGIRIECWEGKELFVLTAEGAKFTSGGFESDGWEIGINANEHGLIIGTGGSITAARVQTMASSKTHGIALGVAANLRRLHPCPCGSNLPYKKCHGVILH